MLSYVCIVSDRGGPASFRSANDEILDNGNFLLLLFDIQQPLMLINGNNNERKCLQIASPQHHHHPHPPTPITAIPFAFSPMPLWGRGPRCVFAPVRCCASIVSLRGGDPVSAGCISSSALYSGEGFRLSKHLRATAFLANTANAISPFLSIRH